VEAERLLATVLFTDIVGSTERATELGDRDYRGLLHKHHALVRRALDRFGGQEIGTTGDGFLALFSDPERAIRCACAVRDGVRELGLEVRAGLHTGEVERAEKAVGGIAVHIGARVAAQAAADEVLVSNTVRDLVEGSGFGFEDRGSRVLKGVRGEWRLFAVTSCPAEAKSRHASGWLPRLGRRQAILVGLLAGGLLLGLATLQTLHRDRGSAAARPAAEVGDSGAPAVKAGTAPGIAVLPFTVTGPDLALWREGMVDLLSLNLDGAAGIRAIDPRTVLSKWRSDIGEDRDPADREAALQVARRAGGRYALLGSMVGSRDGVRLSAEVYDLQSGALRGKAQVDGSPDSLLSLIDRLSVEVLRAGLVQGTAELPEPDLRRITTSSLPALKAYLEGEQEFRAHHFKEATAAFSRAVAADSTFAFALYRLSLQCGWEVDIGCDPSVNYDSLLARFVDRLPERDSLLLSGLLQQHSGPADEALETFRQFTDRYPDVAEGWFLLGDVSYHGTAPGYSYIPRDEAMQDFRRALELDPGFGPAYIHLINAIFALDDSAEARQLVAGMRQIDSTSQEAAGTALSYALIFGDDIERAAAVAALDTAGTEELLWTIGVQSNWLTTCCLTSPGHWEQDLLVAQELTTRVGRRSPGGERADVRASAQRAIGYIYTTRGRLREAREAFERGGELSSQTASLILQGALAADADPELKKRAAEALDLNYDTEHFLLGALAAREHRWEDVDQQLEELKATWNASSRVGPDGLWTAAVAQALRGYSASVRGDRQAAIRAFTDALPHLGGTLTILLRLELGKAWLGEGDFRRAEQYLRHVEFALPAVNTPTEFYLGQAYEGLGNIPEAKLHYGRFVSWWKDCDPGLRPMWEQGRAALERLTGPAKL
jgi:class 3 adenylate cyclase/tetratricopeptide (TPR) repeat protein/TolB-like protein